MSNKDKLLNCYQDLQRAAVSYYRNPDGSTHKAFVNHALELLKGVKDKKLRNYKKKLTEIQNRLSKSEDYKKFADEILTVGILLKSTS